MDGFIEHLSIRSLCSLDSELAVSMILHSICYSQNGVCARCNLLDAQWDIQFLSVAAATIVLTADIVLTFVYVNSRRHR